MEVFQKADVPLPWTNHKRCHFSYLPKVCDWQCSCYVTMCHDYTKKHGCHRAEFDGACDIGWHHRGLVQVCTQIQYKGKCKFGCTPTWPVCHDHKMNQCSEEGKNNCTKGWHYTKARYLQILCEKESARKRAKTAVEQPRDETQDDHEQNKNDDEDQQYNFHLVQLGLPIGIELTLPKLEEQLDKEFFRPKSTNRPTKDDIMKSYQWLNKYLENAIPDDSPCKELKS